MVDQAISTEGLTKRIGWHTPVTLLDAVDLAVPAGTGYGLLGPNGAGKTTLMKLLLGLSSITAGRAELFGVPVPTPASRHRVGFLPEVVNHHDHLTVREYLHYHARLARLERISEKTQAALERVGLAEVGGRQLGHCSKGMKQRADLARVLMLDARLILLDEPVTGLDPLGQAVLRDLLIELKRDGITMLINSHAVGILTEVCDTIGILDRGRLVRSGPIAELLATGRFVVTAVAPPADNPVALLPLPPAAVKPLGDGCWRFEFAAPLEAARLVTELATRGFQIREATPGRRSLEDLFVQVVGTAPRGDGARAAAGEPTMTGGMTPPAPPPPPAGGAA